jgi:transposase
VLAPFYPKMGRPSVDPVLMIRMLVVGYVFAIRSERALCREVQVNLAYCWFCGLRHPIIGAACPSPAPSSAPPTLAHRPLR